MNGSKCQLCDGQVAKIHITQIKNDQLYELHVCPECARNYGLAGPGKTPDLSAGGPLGKTPEEEEAAFAEPREESKTCPACGQTFRGFRESGRLGCRHCYDAFEEDLIPLLRKVQMGLTHHGKATGARNAAPVKSVVVDIQHLREELKKAVSEEDFEKAARLRDEIRGLESETKA